MARETYIYDRTLKKVVPKDENYFARADQRRGAVIIRDIEPYKTVAADTNGKRVVVGGRRQHREFLNRNGYVEMGNEQPRNRLQYGPGPGEVAREIKRVLGE
jgi:hypothetical protein